jgi:cell division inhibitor SepF
MASFLKRTMTYLGLGDDDDYADYDNEYAEPAPPDRRPTAPRREVEPTAMARRPPQVRDEVAPDVRFRDGGTGTVRPLPPDPRPPPSHDPSAGVGAVRSRNPGTTGAGPTSRGAVVRPIPTAPTAKPHIVAPTSFNEAQEVADNIKGNVPVIMNLQDVDRDLARRLIDFASGLCYGLSGTMERVANSVYLLTPSDVEVSAEDRRRIVERNGD